MSAERTRVGIIGAGPAGLVLGQLLHARGIDNVILESRSREYVESRIRAGVLEQNTVDLLHEIGAGARMRREGLVHEGVILSFNGRRHRIDLADLTGGRAITIYGQHEVLKDLIELRLRTIGPDSLRFEAEAVAVDDVGSESPSIRYRAGGEELALACEFVAGCDGFHGVARDAVPADALKVYDKEYPFGWLGILAQVAPSSDELIYAYHPRGFALHSMRSPEISRLYLQVAADEPLEDWPDERIWDELEVRLGAEGFELRRGPILEKGVTTMRSFMVEPMQHARLFLAGDAAHIVPPTGGKGLNLAVADVVQLDRALGAWYDDGRTDLLDGYSEACLRRVWRVQDFSNFMTDLMHLGNAHGSFDYKLQEARFAYVARSEAMSRTIAENYVGLATV